MVVADGAMAVATGVGFKVGGRMAGGMRVKTSALAKEELNIGKGVKTLEEADLRAYNEKYGLKENPTPDELTFKDGKLVGTKQKYEASGSTRTQAVKVADDLIQASKTAKAYEFEQSSNYKVTIEVTGNPNTNIGKVVTEDLIRISNGQKPQVLPEGFANKNLADINAVIELINNGQVKFVFER